MTVQTLDLRHSLQLRLTQKMQQAIKLLQMSNQELSSFVTEYVTANPLLEMGEDTEESWDTDDLHRGDYDTPLQNLMQEREEKPEDTLYALVESEDEVIGGQREERETEWQDETFSREWGNPGPLRHDGISVYDPMVNRAQEDTLKTVVKGQMDIVIHHPQEKEIASLLFDFLEDDGYLITPWTVIVTVIGEEIGADISHIQSVLEKLQTLEPVGVFARSLEECLTLQLKDRGLYTEAIGAFVHALKHHHGSPTDLAQKMGLSLNTCHAYLDLLKSLNPNPSACLHTTQVEHVVPDLLMHRHGDDWLIELNALTLPQVYLNSAYYLDLRTIMKGHTDKTFLQEKYMEAKWLLKSLHQRAVNILKVTDAVIRKQADFFKNPEGAIRPLTLKDIALDTQLSESTVSRVTTDKYIQTPRGLFSLKYFFSGGAQQRGDSETLCSAKSIQAAILHMIQQESPQVPLSDGEIMAHLKEQGIKVARRTVAKYRDLLKIENASTRLTYYKWNQGKRSSTRSL